MLLSPLYASRRWRGWLKLFTIFVCVLVKYPLSHLFPTMLYVCVGSSRFGCPLHSVSARVWDLEDPAHAFVFEILLFLRLIFVLSFDYDVYLSVSVLL